MKKILYFILVIFLLAGCTKANNKTEENISIVVTNFPSYDFTRAIISKIDENLLGTNNFTNVNIKLLIKPGIETHSYDPTPKDIIYIQNADIFVRMGGHSEAWADKILENTNKLPKKIIKLQDYIESSHHHEESENHNEHEHDEHFWTNSNNAIKMIEAILQAIIDIDQEKNNGQNIQIYKNNAKEYISTIKNLSNEIRSTVDNSANKLLIFGDRFPFAHFVEEYNLDYVAAFDGCSSAVEAKTSKIAELIDIAKNSNVKAIFAIEMSNRKIANTIADATNTFVIELHSCQNLTKDDFNRGVTYAYTMKSNLEALKIGL